MITRFNSAGNERVKGVRRALTRQHLSERCQGEPGSRALLAREVVRRVDTVRGGPRRAAHLRKKFEIL
jgi:hypothetical protein